MYRMTEKLFMNDFIMSIESFFAVFGVFIVIAAALKKDKEIKKIQDKKKRIKYTAITALLLLCGIFAGSIQSYLFWWFIISQFAN